MCVRVLTTKTKITIGVVKIFWASLISAGAHYLRIILFYSWRVCRRKSQMKWWTCKSEAQRATVPPSFILSVAALCKKTPLDLDVSTYYPIRVGVSALTQMRSYKDRYYRVSYESYVVTTTSTSSHSDPRLSQSRMIHSSILRLIIFQPVQLFSALWKPYHAERYKAMFSVLRQFDLAWLVHRRRTILLRDRTCVICS